MKTITSNGCARWTKGDIITICGAQYEIARDPWHSLPKRLRGRTDPAIQLRDYRPMTGQERGK